MTYEGPPHAKIYIVGDYLSAGDTVEKQCFSGGAGRLLNRLLMEAGINRSECRIGNVMMSTASSYKDFYYDAKCESPRPELQQGILNIKEDIKRCSPHVVLTLGELSLKVFTDEHGVDNWRGSILFSKQLGCKVIPSIHPSTLLKSWDNVPLAMFDMRRVNEESRSPDHKEATHEFRLRPSFESVISELQSYRRDKVTLSFDVETDEDGHINALALAPNAHYALSIPFTNNTGAPYWRLEEEVVIWKELKLLLEDPEVKKIAQNAQFDITMFRINPNHIHVRGLILDTMCGHHCIYAEMAASEEGATGKRRLGGGKSLGLLCSIYTRQPYYKHWGHSGNDDMFWKYNCMDAAITYECATEIRKEMVEFGVSDFYDKYVNPLIPILLDVQIRGVKIDHSLRIQGYNELEKELIILQHKLDYAVGYPVNCNSPMQLKELLYTDFNLAPKYKRGKRGEVPTLATDEEALTELSSQYDLNILHLILAIRENRKLMGTYLTDKGGDDGRMRCSYVIGGTDTGRLASRKSVFGSGGNLQNIPPGVCRRMFVPDEGKVFIQVDESQAEARVVAYDAQEESMINVFESGGDIHRLNGSWIYNCKPEEVTDVQRQTAKKGVHALDYGLGPVAFSKLFGCSIAEAKVLHQKYFDRFPKLRAWHLGIQATLNRSRTLTTPLGRRRTFFGLWGDQLFRQAYSYIPQATISDILNMSLIKLVGKYPEVEVMLQIHDAYIIQCFPNEVDVWVERMQETFNIPVQIKGRTVIIPVEFKVGENWNDMCKYKKGEYHGTNTR